MVGLRIRTGSRQPRRARERPDLVRRSRVEHQTRAARVATTRTTIANRPKRASRRSPEPIPGVRMACTSRSRRRNSPPTNLATGTRRPNAVRCVTDHPGRPDAHHVQRRRGAARYTRCRSRACCRPRSSVPASDVYSFDARLGPILTGPTDRRPHAGRSIRSPAKKRATCPILTGSHNDVRLTRCDNPAGRQFQVFGISRPPSSVSDWLSRGRVSTGFPSARLWSICAGCRMCAQ